MIDTLIYDRTQADVDRVFTLKNKILTQGFTSLSTEEQTEYMSGMRGAYNYSDLNRVGNAVKYLAERFVTLPIELEEYRRQVGVGYAEYFDVPYDFNDVNVEPKVDWTVRDVPTSSQIATYLGNLTNLRGIIALPSDTPAVPNTLDNLTYEVANDIEKLLKIIDTELLKIEEDLYSKINRAVAAFVYSGMVYSGE